MEWKIICMLLLPLPLAVSIWEKVKLKTESALWPFNSSYRNDKDQDLEQCVCQHSLNTNTKRDLIVKLHLHRVSGRKVIRSIRNCYSPPCCLVSASLLSMWLVSAWLCYYQYYYENPRHTSSTVMKTKNHQKYSDHKWGGGWSKSESCWERKLWLCGELIWRGPADDNIW